MRDDCKFFQTRTYRSGDTARFCALDLAPEAPWRCPTNCPRYTKRVGEVGTTAPDGGRPGPEHDDEIGEGVAALLGSADEVISAASSEIMAEERKRQRAQAIAEAREPWWKQLRRRPPWRR
jgi:hypothetical protein